MYKEGMTEYEKIGSRMHLQTGVVYKMGPKAEEIRALFFIDQDIDPKTVPDKLQLWYVEKECAEDFMIARVVAEKPDCCFMGSLLTAKMPIPEDGVLFNFRAYNILSTIEYWVDNKEALPEEKQKTIELLKLVAKVEGYDENNPDATPYYVGLYEDWSLTMEEFAETV